MSKVRLNKPNITAPKVFEEIEEGELTDLIYCGREDIFGKAYSRGEIEREELDCGNVDKTYFKNIRIVSCNAKGALFTDVIFEDCDLSNSTFNKAAFHRVLFKNCKLTGVSIADSVVSDSQFSNCVGQLTSFNKCKMRQVLFEKNELTNLSFYECTLNDFQMHENRFNRIEIAHTLFKGVNLASNETDGASFALESLKGARISVRQSIMISEAYGMEVE